jgi:hypothetical protein
MHALLKSSILKALDCFLCAAKLRILLAQPPGNHGHPKGDNQGQSPCMLVVKIKDFNKPWGDNQGHLKSSILTAYAQPSCAYCSRSLACMKFFFILQGF